jgi:hypothetical protein
MTLQHHHEGNVNPFACKNFHCPLCASHDFTSQDFGAVYCDGCGARFSVRPTAGDPGCVVDCFATPADHAHVWAPVFECKQCTHGTDRHVRFPWQDLTCPLNLNHGTMTQINQEATWTPPTKALEKFYIILKTGDYCSGWLNGNCVREGGHNQGPTQLQWLRYCKTIERRREKARAKAAAKEVTQ